MTDDEAFLAAYEEALNTGKPVQTYATDEITDIYVTSKGQVAIDFVFARSPDNRAIVWKLILGTEAAHKLKIALINSQNIPDTPIAKRGARSLN